jgi:hypothetical protein
MGASSPDECVNTSVYYGIQPTRIDSPFLVQTLPFLLKNFITEEVKEINNYYKEKKIDKKVTDPSDAITLVFVKFLDWYNHLRQPLTTSRDIKELGQKTYQLQRLLKAVFPQKAGTMCFSQYSIELAAQD